MQSTGLTHRWKAELMEQSVNNCDGSQKTLISLKHSLFGSKNIAVLLEYTIYFTLTSSINMFFLEKIQMIKMEFPPLETYSVIDIDIIMPVCTAVFDTFQAITCIINKLNITTCGLDRRSSDPTFPILFCRVLFQNPVNYC